MPRVTYELPFTYTSVPTTPNSSKQQAARLFRAPGYICGKGRDFGAVYVDHVQFAEFFKKSGIEYEIAAKFDPCVIRFFSRDDLECFKATFNLPTNATGTFASYGLDRDKPVFTLPFTYSNTITKSRKFKGADVTHEEFNEFFEDTGFRYEVSHVPIPEGDYEDDWMAVVPARATGNYTPLRPSQWPVQSVVKFQDEMEMRIFMLKFGIGWQ